MRAPTGGTWRCSRPGAWPGRSWRFAAFAGIHGQNRRRRGRNAGQPSCIYTSPRKVSKCGDRVCGGFAAADGAFHVAVPLRGALGAGPVDASDRRAPRLAVGRPDSGREVRAVTAAGELLGHPVPLEILLRAGGRLAEVADEAAQHGVPPLGRAAAGPDARLLALQEAHQDAGPAGWW